MAGKICLLENSQCYSYDGKKFGVSTPKSHDLIGAFLSASSLLSYTLSLPLGIDEESFDATVESTLLEEGILDSAKQYKIAYTKRVMPKKESWHIEVFAIEQSVLYQSFASVLDQSGHLDFLAIPYLEYEGLYANKRIERVEREIFVHLSLEESFIVLYLEGRYLAHRLIPPLSTLARKVRLSPEKLLGILSIKGIEEGLYAPDEKALYHEIFSNFSDLFKRIEATLRHQKAWIDAAPIERFTLDFQGREIPGFWNLVDLHGFESSKKTLLRPFKETPLDQIQLRIRAEYLLAVWEHRLEEAPNLSVFEPEPPFYQSHSAKFLLALLLPLLILAGWWYLQEERLEKLHAKEQMLKKEYTKLQSQKKLLQGKISKIKKALQEQHKVLDRSQKKIARYHDVAEELYRLRRSALERRELLSDFNRIMKRYLLKADLFEEEQGQKAKVLIRSRYNDRERIAQFMNEMKEAGYQEVSTKLIQRENDSYLSSVEIER